jgi:hypothetical protein
MSTPQETVTSEGDTITIQPAEADTVYLPEYDPWLVYGSPVAVYPGWNDSSGLNLTKPYVLFGLGIGIGAFAAFGWGYHHWGTIGTGTAWFTTTTTTWPAATLSPVITLSTGAYNFLSPGGFNVGAWHRPAGMRYGLNGFNRGGVTPDLAFHAAPASAEASMSECERHHTAYRALRRRTDPTVPHCDRLHARRTRGRRNGGPRPPQIPGIAWPFDDHSVRP